MVRSDQPELEGLRQDFLTDNLRMKPLLAALTDTAVYQAGDFGGGADDAIQRQVRRVDQSATLSATG